MSVRPTTEPYPNRANIITEQELREAEQAMFVAQTNYDARSTKRNRRILQDAIATHNTTLHTWRVMLDELHDEIIARYFNATRSSRFTHYAAVVSIHAYITNYHPAKFTKDTIDKAMTRAIREYKLHGLTLYDQRHP